MDRTIKYARGYKYQLRENYLVQTRIHPERDIVTELVRLDRDGLMLIRKYFAWDGCSGPTWDDKTNMRGGLVHDAGAYLLRAGLLDPSWLPVVNGELRRIMLEDGAWPWRARYYEKAVSLFNGWARPESKRPILTAP